MMAALIIWPWVLGLAVAMILAIAVLGCAFLDDDDGDL